MKDANPIPSILYALAATPWVSAILFVLVELTDIFYQRDAQVGVLLGWPILLAVALNALGIMGILCLICINLNKQRIRVAYFSLAGVIASAGLFALFALT